MEIMIIKIMETTKLFIVSQLKLYNEYVKNIGELRKKYGIKGRCRNPNFPEDISETIIMYLIQRNDKTCTRDTKSGDLWSESEKKIECKCFTSITGPISFGPKSNWNIIYFLDGSQYIKNKFTLYRTDMSNIDFSNIKINKNHTYKDVCNLGKRPRIGWNKLKPQIVYSVIFDDFIENL
jgi:hypothetical protein